MCRDDGTVSVFVKLRTAGATEYLQHIQHTEVDELTALRVIDIRALQQTTAY